MGGPVLLWAPGYDGEKVFDGFRDKRVAFAVKTESGRCGLRAAAQAAMRICILSSIRPI